MPPQIDLRPANSQDDARATGKRGDGPRRRAVNCPGPQPVMILGGGVLANVFRKAGYLTLPAQQSCAAGGPAFSLHGWARRVAIGTEHAAVARLRTQHSATAPAVVEELAGVRGYHLRLPVPTLRTGDGRCQNGGHRSHSTVRKAERTCQQPWPSSLSDLTKNGSEIEIIMRFLSYYRNYLPSYGISLIENCAKWLSPTGC